MSAEGAVLGALLPVLGEVRENLNSEVGETTGSGRQYDTLPAAALGVLLQLEARWEERLLSERFADYPSYAATTARFIPALRTSRR